MYRVDEEAKRRYRAPSIMDRIKSVFCSRKKDFPSLTILPGPEVPSAIAVQPQPNPISIPPSNTFEATASPGTAPTYSFPGEWSPTSPSERVPDATHSDTTSAPSTPLPKTPSLQSPNAFSDHLPQIGSQKPTQDGDFDDIQGPSPITSPASTMPLELPTSPITLVKSYSPQVEPLPSLDVNAIFPPLASADPPSDASTLELFQLCSGRLQYELQQMGRIRAYLDRYAGVREEIKMKEARASRMRVLVMEQQKEVEMLQEKVEALKKLSGANGLAPAAGLDLLTGNPSDDPPIFPAH